MVKKQERPDPFDSQRLLTVSEVARLLHVSRTLVYWLIQRRKLRTVRINRALRFRPEDVQDFIRRRTAVRRKPPKRSR